MSDFRGPYLGFTYGGIHSSEFNIVRTSTNNRYNQNLTPDFSDKTTSVAGADQVYYFKTDFTLRVFQVPFAFDNIDEATLIKLKRWLNPKKNEKLVFDEAPYKYYYAKPQNAVQFNYLAFDERHNGGAERVYKGEGTIQFICYYPFAKSLYRSLEEWCLANDIPYSEDMEAPEWFDEIFLPKKLDASTFTQYNYGDYPMDWKLYTTKTGSINLGCMDSSGETHRLSVDGLILEDGDLGVCFDSATHLLRGASYKTKKLEMDNTKTKTYQLIDVDYKIDDSLLDRTGLVIYDVYGNMNNFQVEEAKENSPVKYIIIVEDSEGNQYKEEVPFEVINGKLMCPYIQVLDEKSFIETSAPLIESPKFYVLVEVYKTVPDGSGGYVLEDTDWYVTDNIYNKYIVAGSFFKLPAGKFSFIGFNPEDHAQIDYNYIYY